MKTGRLAALPGLNYMLFNDRIILSIFFDSFVYDTYSKIRSEHRIRHTELNKNIIRINVGLKSKGRKKMDWKERSEKKKEEIEEKVKKKKSSKTQGTSEDKTEKSKSVSDGMRLKIIDEGLRRLYLLKLSERDTVKVMGLPDEDEDLSCNVRLYHVKEAAYQKNENVTDKLATVYNALSIFNGSVFAVIDSDGKKTDLYLGVRNNDLTPEKKDIAAAMGDTFADTLRGNLPGIRIKACDSEKTKGISDRVLLETNVSVASVMGSFRSEDKNSSFTQGLENLLNAMQGKKYIGMIIAENGSADAIEERRENLQELYSKLSLYKNVDTSESSDAESSDSKKYSKMSVKEKVKTLGNFIVNMAGIAGGIAAMGPMGALVGSMISGQVTNFINGIAPTEGERKDTQSTYENRLVADLLRIIDDEIKRTEEFEKYGMWDVAGYFASEDLTAAKMGAVNYKALMSGDGSAHEVSAINTWKAEEGSTDLDEIRRCLSRFIHPRFQYCVSEDGQYEIVTNAAMAVTGKDLALHMGLPRASAPGVKVKDSLERD